MEEEYDLLDDWYEEDAFDMDDDTAECGLCGHWYCRCCGCNCWMYDLDEEEQEEQS